MDFQTRSVLVVSLAALVLFISSGIAYASPIVAQTMGPGYQCAYISNLTAGSSQSVTVIGNTYRISIGVISPNYIIAFRLNAQVYSLAIHNVIALGTMNNVNYTLKLTNVTYSTTQPAATVAICGTSTQHFVQQNASTSSTSFSGTYNISLYHSLDVQVNGLGISALFASNSSQNMTEEISINQYNTTAKVSGYSLIRAYNVSIQSGTNVTATVTAEYPCSIAAGEVKPFMLVNGSWSELSEFKVNQSACTVSVSVNGDPIIGIFEFVGVPVTSATTTQPYKLVQVNNYSNPYGFVKLVLSVYLVDVIGIVIIIAAILVSIYWFKIKKDVKRLEQGRKRRRSGPKGRIKDSEVGI